MKQSDSVARLSTSVPKESELFELLLKERNLQYSEYGIDQTILASWQARKLSSLLSSSDKNWSIALRRDGVLAGLAVLEPLPWDSRIFGFDIASLRFIGGDEPVRILEASQKKCLARGVRTIFSRVRSENISTCQSLEDTGFRLMDGIVTFTIDMQKQKLSVPKNPSVKVRPCDVQSSNDLEGILSIARESWSKARVAVNHFHADPNLPKERSDELYVQWAKNSVNGRDDFCFLAEVDDEIAGFVTGKTYTDLKGEIGLEIGALSLAAVASWARDKGVFTSLAAEAIRRISADGARFVEIGTHHTNYPVQRASTRLGLRICNSYLSLHWSNRNG